jgi:hypothetical protein
MRRELVKSLRVKSKLSIFGSMLWTVSVPSRARVIGLLSWYTVPRLRILQCHEQGLLRRDTIMK